MAPNIILFLFLFGLHSAVASAQTPAIDDLAIKQLANLQRKMGQLKLQIEESRQMLLHGDGTISNADLQKKVQTLQNDFQTTQNTFLQVAANIASNPETSEGPRNIISEIYELVTPVLDGLRRLSEKPRNIEKLRRQIADYQKQETTFIAGIKKIEDLLANPLAQDIHSGLRSALKELNFRKEQLEIEISQAQINLNLLIGPSRPLLATWRDFFLDFLQNKGRNFLLCLLVFFLSLFGFSLAKKRIFVRGRFRESFAWAERPLLALYSAISVLTSLLTTLFALYLLNDWFLLTVLLLMLTAFLWSIKQWVPRFLEQTRLILNLGPAREGERVVWNGIPWKIHKLNFQTTLINEQLAGGTITIPISEVAKLNSRRIVAHEPWFPCRTEDWVQLDDGNYGQIVAQTPEQVILRSKLTDKHYSLPAFLAQNPQNYSRGFLIIQKFGIDYREQERITTEIVELFQRSLVAKLANCPFNSINVEFDSAAESALNLIILLACPGNVAPQRFYFERLVQKSLVEICNEQQISIPFQQLDDHLVEKNSVSEKAT